MRFEVSDAMSTAYEHDPKLGNALWIMPNGNVYHSYDSWGGARESHTAFANWIEDYTDEYAADKLMKKGWIRAGYVDFYNDDRYPNGKRVFYAQGKKSAAEKNWKIIADLAAKSNVMMIELENNEYYEIDTADLRDKPPWKSHQTTEIAPASVRVGGIEGYYPSGTPYYYGDRRPIRVRKHRRRA